MQDTLRKGNEGLKTLVKQNFDRFVNAKNSVEIVYADMRKRGVAENDHGLTSAANIISSNYFLITIIIILCRGIPASTGSLSPAFS